MQVLKKKIIQALETQLHRDQEGKECLQHKAAQLQIVLETNKVSSVRC